MYHTSVGYSCEINTIQITKFQLFLLLSRVLYHQRLTVSPSHHIKHQHLRYFSRYALIRHNSTRRYCLVHHRTISNTIPSISSVSNSPLSPGLAAALVRSSGVFKLSSVVVSAKQFGMVPM